MQLSHDREQLESELSDLGQQIDMERQQLEEEKHQLFIQMKQGPILKNYFFALC